MNSPTDDELRTLHRLLTYSWVPDVGQLPQWILDWEGVQLEHPRLFLGALQRLAKELDVEEFVAADPGRLLSATGLTVTRIDRLVSGVVSN